MTDHTRTEKINDDSIEPCQAIRSSNENRYDNDLEINPLDYIILLLYKYYDFLNLSFQQLVVDQQFAYSFNLLYVCLPSDVAIWSEGYD